MNLLLASGIDSHFLIGLAVAIAFSLIASFFAIFERSRFLWLIALLGAAAYYWRAFAGFAIVAAIAYGVARWLGGMSDRDARWRWACITLFLLVIVFTLGRVEHWDRSLVLPGSVSLAFFSLDMWLALRLVTLFWEIGSGSIQAPTLTGYVAWVCLPITVSGPLIRYSQFPSTVVRNPSLWASAAWWLELGTAAAKLAAGTGLYLAQAAISERPHAQLLSKAAAALITGPIGFYLTTAGFYHLMEVLGRPCGIKVPVSFNYPIGRENISAFWMNWNMTATFVFRDYLFYNRWGRSTYNVYFNTVLLFTLVGLWHAANAYWILWGFLHGLLFSGYLLWRKYGQRLGKLPFQGTVVSTTAARVLTYLCVCICWYLPSKIIQKLGGVF